MAQIHTERPHSPIPPGEKGAAHSNGLDPPIESHPTLVYATNQKLEADRVIGMARIGAVMIMVFQFAYLESDLSVWRILPTRLMVAHVATILVGLAALGLTFSNHQWVSRQWRMLTFLACVAEIAGMVRISQITSVSEPLFVTCILLIVATGSTIPWEPRWQAAFNLIPLIALLISVPHTYDGFDGFHWTEIAAALVFAQITNLTFTRFRAALQRLLAEEQASGERLRAEITQREQGARDLAESAGMLRTVFDATVDLIAVIRLSDGALIDVNQAVEQYRVTRETTGGLAAPELLFWPDPAGRSEFLKQVEREGVVRNRELEMRRPDGEPATMLVSAALAKIAGEKCVVSMWRDIGSLKETERELIAARESAVAASQAKSEFLSGMSHEIRTPMNAILGMSELFADTPLNDQQRKYLSVMQSNGNSLIALINDILDLAKVEAGRLNLEQLPFDLETVLDTVGEALAVSAHTKGLELVMHLPPAVPRNLIGDPLRLKQVLVNLIGNAIKFTAHGQIVINVERMPSPYPSAMLRFKVADTGIGIAPAKVPELFSNFTQANNSVARQYGGSGLGLSIVRRLVDLMGGRTWVKSQLGVGSTFYFTANFGVNANASAADESRDAGTAAPVAQLAGMRALVVDDNRVNRMVVREIIAAYGVDVAEADSGAQALGELESARRNGHPFNLMILDCRMPDMDGFKVVQQLRRGSERDDTVVLMPSSDNLNIQIPRVRELGLDAYIVKPVRRAELLAAIATALGARHRTNIAAAATMPLAALRDDIPALTLAAAPPTATSPPEAAPIIFEQLLLVDDSADNRLLISSYLKRLPYHIDEAQNGEEAFQKAIATSYDLILMDLQMPVVDGLEATRMIRAWELAHGAPRTPIIVLTASVLQDDVRNTLAAGANAHLSKPVTKGMLLQAISDVASAEGDASLGRDDAVMPAR